MFVFIKKAKLNFIVPEIIDLTILNTIYCVVGLKIFTVFYSKYIKSRKIKNKIIMHI